MTQPAAAPKSGEPAAPTPASGLRWWLWQFGRASIALGAVGALAAWLIGEIGDEEWGGSFVVVFVACVLSGCQGVTLRGDAPRRYAVICAAVCAAVWVGGSIVAFRLFAGSRAGWDDMALPVLVLAFACLPLSTLPGRWRDLYLCAYLAYFVVFFVWLLAPLELAPPHSSAANQWLVGLGLGGPLVLMSFNNVLARALAGSIVIVTAIMLLARPIAAATGIREEHIFGVTFGLLVFVWLWFSVPARTRSRGPSALIHAVFSFHSLVGVAVASALGVGLAAGVYALARGPLSAPQNEALEIAAEFLLSSFAMIWMCFLVKPYKRYVLSMQPRWQAEDEQAAAATDQRIQAALKGLKARWKVERQEANEAAVASQNDAEMERLRKMMRERES
jgi:hypothetical protein